MAARRAQGPGKPVTGMVMLVATAAAGYAIYQGFPGIAALWAGLVVSAWMYPPAAFTGKKDSRGYATPGDPGEQQAMNQYRLWSDLKFKLILPNADWLPGLNVRLSFLVAALAGFAAYWIPVTDVEYTGGYGTWINAAAAFISVAQYAASRRRFQVADDENPGARFDTLLTMAKESTGKFIGLIIGGLAVGAVLGTAAAVFIPLLLSTAGMPPVPEAAIWTVFLIGGPLGLLAKPWITAALEHWRVVVAAREEWSPRWQMLKQDPAPRLVDRQQVGPAVVDTFDAPPSVGAVTYFAMTPKLGPAIGGGSKFAIVDTPNMDSKNQPMPGTKHPLRFDIVQWPNDEIPDVTDHSTPKDVVFQLARCAIVWMAESQQFAKPILEDVTLLTVNDVPEPEIDETAAPGAEPAPAGPGTPAAWAMTWFAPEGPPPSYIRSQGIGDFSAAFNAEVLVDHRANGGAGVCYFGALTDQNTVWNPSVGVDDSTMYEIMEDDMWDGRWIEAMKQGTNPPVRQGNTAQSARLKNGIEINHLSFVTRMGMTPQEFRLIEPKLPTVMKAAPFVAMTGYPGPGQRPGERHAQAFSLIWSDQPVPSKPDVLAPVPGSEAPKWVLAGLFNEAFKAARLADRPEIAAAQCLTRPESRQHIWKVDLRLYGGVTLADVRGAANKIRQHWASDWLRVAEAKDGCTVIVGARPTKVRLADPRHEKYLLDLEWQQVFIDSGLTGLGGRMPKLTDNDSMPKNEQVKILTFDVTGTGLDFTSFTGVRNKLEVNSQNAWVEPRRVKNKANEIQILACEVNPMPEKADYDWAHIEASSFIPFATGVDGEPIEYNFRLDPHLLIAGASGGGKSVLMQSLMYGALMRGYELYISDPTKAGADFRFAQPYARAFTSTVFEAAAMMKAVYAEVTARKKIVAAHGVGNYRDLPENIRPRHMVLVLDEFTSLMGQDPVPPASDDPEMDAERELILATNRARQEIGVYTGKIAREARFVGVTLFLATQKLAAKMLDTIPGAGDLKVNLSRLLMGKATTGDKQSALRAPFDAPDLGDAIPPGRGLFETTAGSAMAIQAWYNPAEQQILGAKLAEVLTPLEEAQKLNIAAFMPKLPDDPYSLDRNNDGVIDLGEIELAMEDLDLGEIELTLDDLEVDDADNDTGTEGPAEAEPETEMVQSIEPPVAEDQLVWDDTPATPVDTAVFFDVDGVIAPGTGTPGMTRLAAPGHGTIVYDPALVQRLAELDARQVWLTSWEHDAPAYLGHLLPTAGDVLTGTSDTTGWWKIDSALAWLEAHPDIRRFSWIDDELANEDPVLGVTFREIAAEAFEDLGVEHCLVVPDYQRGITEDEVARVEAFVDGLAWEPSSAAAPVTAPVRATAASTTTTTSAAATAVMVLDDDDPFSGGPIRPKVPAILADEEDW